MKRIAPFALILATLAAPALAGDWAVSFPVLTYPDDQTTLSTSDCTAETQPALCPAAG